MDNHSAKNAPGTQAAYRPLLPDLARIPHALRNFDQWVAWRGERKSDDRIAKIPYQPNGRRASVADPNTWSSFAQAAEAYRRKGSFFAAPFHGVGFVLTDSDPFVGIDLDHCLTKSGKPAAWAAFIVDTIDSYTETSPSGRGLRIILKGQLPVGRKRRDSVEMYDANRYLTLTGHVRDGRAAVKARQPQLDSVYRGVFGEVNQAAAAALSPQAFDDGPEMDDDDFNDRLDIARNCARGDKFIALYDEGDLSEHDRDHSAADLALVGSLAFWFKHPSLIDRAFRGSALMRGKWDEKRGSVTYGQRTIARALDGRTEFFGEDE